MYAYFALAALQAIGGFQQADTIRKNGELQSDIQRMNAKFADLDAYHALEAGYSNSARYDSVVNQTVSAGRAAYASENVAVGYGTAGEVEKNNRTAGLVNTLQIQRGARDAAMGYKTQAINMRLGGNMIDLQSNLNASSAQSSGVLNAIGTAITGYQMGNLTGRGRDKDSGTNDKAWQTNSTTVHVTPTGDGVTAPPDSHGLGWYPDKPGEGNSGQPGFFGYGPRQYYGMGQPNYDSSLGHYSFTSETGG